MAVLVTRPDERGVELVNLLNQVGIVALHLPLIKIEPGRELDQLSRKLAKLKNNDLVFVASKNAAKFATQTLHNTGFRWRTDLTYCAVGQGTGCYFSNQAEVNVYYPLQQENSEGVLTLPIMQNLGGKNLLILRGNGGRELLAQQAKLAGAEVDYVECYQRIAIDYNIEQQTSICKRSGIKTIVVTSLNSLNYLSQFLPADENYWLNCRLITVGQRIADKAIQQGWRKVVISAKADNQQLLQSLQNMN